MIKCSSCGADIPEGATVCPQCGAAAQAAQGAPPVQPPPPQAYPQPPQAYPPPPACARPRPNPVAGFFKDLKNEVADVAKGGKNKVMQMTSSRPAPYPQGYPQAYPPAAPPQGTAAGAEVYPYGLPGAPPLPPGSPPESVLLREPCSHLYPQGNVDSGLAVLTNCRVAYFRSGLLSGGAQGKLVFELPLALVDHTEEMIYPHPQRQNLPLPFTVLATTDGRRFPLFFDRLAHWSQALEEAVAKAKGGGAPQEPDGGAAT